MNLVLLLMVLYGAPQPTFFFTTGGTLSLKFVKLVALAWSFNVGSLHGLINNVFTFCNISSVVCSLIIFYWH